QHFVIEFESGFVIGLVVMRWFCQKSLASLLVVLLISTACQPHLVQPLAQPIATSQQALTLALTSSTPPARNEPTEFVISGVPEVQNPFDPTLADLQLILTSPDGTEVKTDGFWYQAFSADGTDALGQGGWRARFTPTINGQWQAQALFLPANYSSNK